jgi:hypothetical protein
VFELSTPASAGGVGCPATDGYVDARQCTADACPPIGTLKASIVLQADFSSLDEPNERAVFISGFKASVSSILVGVEPSMVYVADIQPGSVVVSFGITPNPSTHAPSVSSDAVYSAFGSSVLPPLGGYPASGTVAGVVVQVSEQPWMLTFIYTLGLSNTCNINNCSKNSVCIHILICRF